ncbi:MAG: hypothetical protein HY913_08215 [Desulfomonile tiedjei]|nr:hypothetical protein [Desulfomonile tiedjei]
MADIKNATPPGDEVILSTKYSGARFWALGGFLAVLACASLYGIYAFTLRGDYFKTACAIVGVLGFVPLSLDALLTKGIYFYSDRVEKLWCFFARRAIPYSKGVVRGPANELHWVQKGYTITEVGANGKRSLLQIPIFYNARFVDQETAKQIDSIMAYMAGDALNKPTRFTRVTLPKEVLCRVKGNLQS